MNRCRPEVGVTLVLDQAVAIPVFCRNVRHTGFLQAVLDDSIDPDRLLGDGECCERGFRIVQRLWSNRPQPFGQSLGDLSRVSGCPDSGAAYAASAAVDQHAVYHEVEIAAPIVYDVIADQNLAESRAV